MKLAVFSSRNYDQEYFDKSNSKKNHQLSYFQEALNLNTVKLTKGFDAICTFVNDQLDKPVIAKLAENGIKTIVLRCAGYNNVDIASAKENKIKVFRVLAYSPNAVAEHAVALILTLNRKTNRAYNQTTNNNFSIENLIGFDICGKTIGVIGTGRIGAIFCEIMLGFGAKVLAFDVLKSSDLQERGVIYKPLTEVFSGSDIISLHCPLVPETHHLINSSTLTTMKQGVMIINTSRGALIHTADTVLALESGKIKYLGIDVYENEGPLFFNDLSDRLIDDDLIVKLMHYPNVLVTAHQGFFTHEAMTEIAQTTLKNLSDFENNIISENEIVN